MVLAIAQGVNLVASRKTCGIVAEIFAIEKRLQDMTLEYCENDWSDYEYNRQSLLDAKYTLLDSIS